MSTFVALTLNIIKHGKTTNTLDSYSAKCGLFFGCACASVAKPLYIHGYFPIWILLQAESINNRHKTFENLF